MARRAPGTTGRTALVVLVVVGSAVGLVGCSSGAQSLRPGPSATSDECVAALDLAPATVLDAPRTPIDTPGALSWGSPAVVLRCGLAEIGPTTATCLDVNGVDWVLQEGTDPMTAVSYGRSPAIELRVPAEYGLDALPAALVDVGPAAAALPSTGRACIG